MSHALNVARPLAVIAKLGRFSAWSFAFLMANVAVADSVNSPNVTINVDTNRNGGAGAGNQSVTVNTITVAETTLPEYSIGAGKAITLTARPGFQFDPTSNVTATSATLGFNGASPNIAAVLTPNGTANETLTFNLTSASSASPTTQDIVRINGIKIRIISAAGAAGPGQTTISISTSSAGGAFNNQGIVAANITRGAADHLEFGVQPTITAAGADLLPVVKIVDFGGNVVLNDSRNVTVALLANPGATTLLGTLSNTSASGLASWDAADHLRLNIAAVGYTLRASHDGASFLTSNTVDSLPFNITAGSPGGLVFSTQPADAVAGEDILLSVTVLDAFGNVATSSSAAITLDASLNPGKWPLLVSSSLTKNAVNGVATWDATDDLHITKSISDYQLAASGVGAPILSDPFDVLPSAPSLVRFVQGPSDVRVGVAMKPPVTAEIVDEFGNRTDVESDIALAILTARCDGGISGNTARSTAGFATFDKLVLSKACGSEVLAAAASGFIATSSDPFTVSAKNEVPIALKSLDLRPGSTARFAATGKFAIPTAKNDKPTEKGGSLTFTGSSASVNFVLPKKGWKKVDSKRASARGFQFEGKKVRGNKCRTVVVKGGSLSANCTLAAGTFQLPEAGPVEMELKLGSGTARFCGQCGGTESGDSSQSFTRLNCTAQNTCP